RHVVLAGGAGAGHAQRCLAFGIHEGKEIIIHKPCQPDDAAQLIPARTINLMYSNLHTSNKVSTMQRGLKAEFFFGLKPSTVSCLLPDVSMRQPDYVRLDAQLDYASSGHWDGITESDHLSARWTGFLNIKHAGLYKFYVSADDSVEFFLDGNLVIQETRCGVHNDLEASLNLQAGEIPFILQMYEYAGNMMLRLHYEGPDSGDQKVLVPTSAFTHMANANTALMTDASHTRGCVGNTGLAGMKGSIFAPSGQDTGVACGFVPVVKSDSPVVLPTSRSKNGHWPEWWAELQDMDIE
ncbi:Rs1, partial [Symbiodinium sp. KB8]